MILSIDPGNEYTAYCIIDNDYKPIIYNKVSNEFFLESISHYDSYNAPCFLQSFEHIACEMISSYGMAVGKTIFDTCVLIGEIKGLSYTTTNVSYKTPSFSLVYRKDVKLNLCNSARAKDSNVIQALIDRFAPNTPNRGKGTKKSPGWFYGFKADIWQAYAVGVTYLDIRGKE